MLCFGTRLSGLAPRRDILVEMVVCRIRRMLGHELELWIVLRSHPYLDDILS
jgi:hypothetical protein